MVDAQAALARPLLAQQVDHRARPDVPEVQTLAALALGVGRQLRQVAGRQVGAASQDVGQAGDQRHRAHVLRLVLDVAQRERREDGLGLRGYQQHATVGRRIQHPLGADGAARAGLVLDDDRALQLCLQQGLDLARHAVGGVAGRLRHDDGQRARAGLRRGASGQQRRQRGGCAQGKADHGFLHAAFLNPAAAAPPWGGIAPVAA